MKKIPNFLFFFAGVIFAQTTSAQIAVVAGAKSTATTLTREQVSALFLGKSTQLPGAGIPLLIDQLETADSRQMFYSKVTEKTPPQVKAVWSRLVFSGKGSPPKEVANSAEVKKLVNTNPDAIGYIEKSAVDTSVRVLLSVD